MVTLPNLPKNFACLGLRCDAAGWTSWRPTALPNVRDLQPRQAARARAGQPRGGCAGRLHAAAAALRRRRLRGFREARVKCYGFLATRFRFHQTAFFF